MSAPAKFAPSNWARAMWMRFTASLLAVAAIGAALALPASASDAASGVPMLPSGLPLISAVSAGSDTIAVDAFGALFVSHDDGHEWKAVAKQWTGRAVKVRLAGMGSGFSAPVFGARRAAHEGAALAVFELVNDANAVWASADGVKWARE